MFKSTKSYKTYIFSFSSDPNNNKNKIRDNKSSSSDSKEKRIRSLLKKERHKILESIFTLNPYPPKDARKEISQQLQMDPREFQIWFQNRRCREKKKTSLVPINTGLQWINTIEESLFLKLSSSLSPKTNKSNTTFPSVLSSQSNFESNSNMILHSIPPSPPSPTKGATRMSLSYLLL